MTTTTLNQPPVTRPASWPNVSHGIINPTRVIRTELQAEREEEFMRTFVSQYFLPKKVSAARKRGAVKMPVPVETLAQLVAAVEKARKAGTRSVSVSVAAIEGHLAELGIAA